MGQYGTYTLESIDADEQLRREEEQDAHKALVA